MSQKKKIFSSAGKLNIQLLNQCTIKVLITMKTQRQNKNKTRTIFKQNHNLLFHCNKKKKQLNPLFFFQNF